MAKSRVINTKFWSDPWVMTKLNSLDRLLFLYLLTNEQTNISGIYEISEHKIAFDTGIDKETLIKAMLPRLEPKVYFMDNWVIMVNFTKHQNLQSADVIKGIQREFHSAPIHIQEYALSRGWGEGLGIALGTKPNLTKLIGGEAPQAFTIEKETTDSDKERPQLTDRRVSDKESVYRLFGDKQPWWAHKQQREAALRLFDLVGVEKVQNGLGVMADHVDDQYCPQASTPFEYEKKLPILKRYIKKNGI